MLLWRVYHIYSLRVLFNVDNVVQVRSHVQPVKLAALLLLQIARLSADTLMIMYRLFSGNIV